MFVCFFFGGLYNWSLNFFNILFSEFLANIFFHLTFRDILHDICQNYVHTKKQCWYWEGTLCLVENTGRTLVTIYNKLGRTRYDMIRMTLDNTFLYGTCLPKPIPQEIMYTHYIYTFKKLHV